MASSLVCNDCGTFLRSVKEAQDHSIATGHTDFAESTHSLLRLVCTECGKSCRSETEWEVHAKRTGHATFRDETDSVVVVDAEKAGKEEQAEKAEETEVERHQPRVDATLLAQLEEMGFGHHRAVRALHATADSNSIEAAIAWLAEHEGDVDIDEPLLIKVGDGSTESGKLGSTITPEEAKLRAAELVRKAKERREQEEKENEKRREQERVRMGKEMAAMAREEEAARLRRLVEERQRDKDEAERARAKILKKLEEDRKERRRQLGLPEELTEEEKEKEEERRKEMEKSKSERQHLSVRPVAVSERMRNLLVEMKKSNSSSDDQDLRLAWSTLLKFVTNVAMRPEDPKYRSIRLTNAAVQSRIGKFPETVDFLHLCGFVPSDSNDDDGTILHLPVEKSDKSILEAAAENLNSALTNPYFGVL